jgi:hypothetical protein
MMTNVPAFQIFHEISKSNYAVKHFLAFILLESKNTMFRRLPLPPKWVSIITSVPERRGRKSL